MTTKTRAELVADYVHDVCRAQTEQARKERLIVLLKDLFKGAEAAQIISDFVSGSEHRITNIERPTGKGSGAADTQYHSTIIEFEKDLRKTGEHAKLQLCEYLTGNWNSRVRLEFTLIATDCLVWEIYAPDFNSLTRLGVLKPSDVRLEKCEAITLTPCSDADKAREMADNFYFFLDRHLFRLEPIPATLDAVRNMFGHDSSVYRAAIACLNDLYSKEKDSSTMQVAYSEWHKFLSIAYGKFDASEDVFLTQSYLSILSKLLAYSVLAGNVKLEKAEINDILTGTAFRKHNIQNFCDDDFFRWTADTTHYDALLPA
ncbi:MAG: hypothetical protein LBQ75_04055, partial [Zoogloeaceae bacterium]|nr:hypothetical protein [Zoogloeaceae bacterium]